MPSRLCSKRCSIEISNVPTTIPVFFQIITEYGLTVTAVVSDSAANVRRAVRQMGYRKLVYLFFKGSNIVSSPRCTNHQLHIMVSRGLAAWKGGSSVKKVKEFARALNTSANTRDSYFA